MRVRVHQPTGQRRVRAGQLALDGVLGKDRHRLLAEGPVPGELLGLKKIQKKSYSLLSHNLIWAVIVVKW